MSARTISRTNLQKTIASIMAPTIQDLNSAIAQAVNALFSQYCRKVDPKGDCIVAPVDPQLLASKFMQDVHANAYLAYNVMSGKPNLPRINFVAQLTPPHTNLLIGRLKPNVALAITGFIVASWANPFPVTAINIYRDTGTPNLWKTATINTAIPIDLPNLIPFEVPMKSYLMLLSEPVLIPPEGMVVLEAVVHSAFNASTDPPLLAWITWIPPVIMVSKSAYIEALAPPRSGYF